MNTMKKLVAALLVMTMLLALASTAFAADCIKCGVYVNFCNGAHAYTEAKDSKKTGNVVKGAAAANLKSTGLVKCVKGKFAKVLVNADDGTTRWFRKCDLKVSKDKYVLVVWAKGGHDMSQCAPGTCKKVAIIDENTGKKATKIEVVYCQTNLRKHHSLEGKTVGTVKKGTRLAYKGYIGADNRGVLFYKVCYKGKICWVSGMASIPVCYR